MEYLNTLDIDRKKIPLHIIGKLFKCKFLTTIEIKKSSKKGWHITMLCSKICHKCRVKYDDKTRFKKDLKRPHYSRNVLFTSKKKVKFNYKKPL